MKTWVLGALALATLVACRPPGKTPADWQSKVAPVMDERRSAFADCWKQEQARVAALVDGAEKKKLQDFLSQKVVVVVTLEITNVGEGKLDELKVQLDQSVYPDGNTLVGGPKGEVDAPLHQCVEKAMTGIRTPFFPRFYPSRGTWKIIFDPAAG